MLSKKFLKLNSKKNYLYDDKNLNIVVLIPVYKEEALIESSIKYFETLQNVSVIYITTSKEVTQATFKIGKSVIESNNIKNIKIINSPNVTGNMATQLNYALKYISEDSMIALYNIDSRPTNSTFDFVRYKYNEGIRVFQQVSYFNDNLNGILASAQRWQNRWSVIFELGRLLLPTNFDKFRYTIGHGFFCIKGLLHSLGGWPEDEINEDNALGYILSLNNIDIHPIPLFECADFARSKKIYIYQQSTWFNGPLYALNYFFKYKKSFNALFMSIINFKAALSWLLGPLLYITITLWSILNNTMFFFFHNFLIIIYITFFNYLGSKLLRTYIKEKFQIKYIFFDIAFYIVHCLGPLLTLCKILARKNNIANKYTTEKKY
ncbi:glycosyltransferase [Enterococcus cecorum]|uniref:glycosyltransferase n=1 Tax=Enterococcus cecorum TaxID=44008 RepID=UPI00200A8ED3|nr:glycosyltransferase family 2 protein [Enterococcus cecorum]MDZ5585308.1 glycosyltransferase family 2 protein [Enterococcus cecorum]